MPEVTVGLTDAQRCELAGAADRAAMTVEQFAAEAMSHAISTRYVLPKTHGTVVPIKSLKSSGD